MVVNIFLLPMSIRHYYHKNIIRYCDRPFESVEEMHETLIKNHNDNVWANDTVIHCGDFSFGSKERTQKEIISRLDGKHIFLKGDHDKWLGNSGSYMWLKHINGHPVIACHYAMKTFWLSHYNSWQVFGHSHGKLNMTGAGKQWDVGVDNNNYKPVHFRTLEKIMAKRPNNFNYINKEK